MDLKNGYWNAGLDEESRPLTAFATKLGLHEYNVVPQGLVCSAAFFQHWVEAKLRRHGVLFEHYVMIVSVHTMAGLAARRLRPFWRMHDASDNTPNVVFCVADS